MAFILRVDFSFSVVCSGFGIAYTLTGRYVLREFSDEVWFLRYFIDCIEWVCDDSCFQ
ncbi:hypothetical protein VCRA2116O372_200016 [Vibrio crassostreae]|nr:hypothetical protein VCRA2116O372_200016 [Vibrio crassostreae]CAK2457594.1 hypothetical protein VCRA2117O377_200107 [Vibrio crassostreae]CAK2466000.1 hypothetical protein VCRA2116O374_230107 [Vibrio crassostreae]CAK2609746.1 hypothetical protein VCRA215O110_100020 [Vibrio crassostreae]CAK2620126.1 hypothetical protein VCRA2119O384_190107 [Vibrio crassostreae]